MLITVGYEGASLERFLDALAEATVATLADVREPKRRHRSTVAERLVDRTEIAVHHLVEF